MKQRITTLFAGGILALTLFGVATAGPVEDGEAAYQRHDYAAATQLWRPLADQGNANAQDNLGLMYYNGEGVRQDYTEAVVWFRKAADQGDALAQASLGKMYYDGSGVAQDYAQAAIWLRKAADRGFAPAQSYLGVMYAISQGVPQDYTLAHMWLNLAASRASDAATRDLAAKNRDWLATKMTPSQIAEAQRMAREWVPPSAPPTGSPFSDLVSVIDKVASRVSIITLIWWFYSYGLWKRARREGCFYLL